RLWPPRSRRAGRRPLAHRNPAHRRPPRRRQGRFVVRTLVHRHGLPPRLLPPLPPLPALLPAHVLRPLAPPQPAGGVTTENAQPSGSSITEKPRDSSPWASCLFTRRAIRTANAGGGPAAGTPAP